MIKRTIQTILLSPGQHCCIKDTCQICRCDLCMAVKTYEDGQLTSPIPLSIHSFGKPFGSLLKLSGKGNQFHGQRFSYHSHTWTAKEQENVKILWFYGNFSDMFGHPHPRKIPIKSRCCFDSVTAESFWWRHNFLGLIHSFIHFYSFASWKKQFLHSFEKPPQILLKLWLTTMTRAVLAQIAVRS